jgi:hypothetical protein
LKATSIIAEGRPGSVPAANADAPVAPHLSQTEAIADPSPGASRLQAGGLSSSREGTQMPEATLHELSLENRPRIISDIAERRNLLRREVSLAPMPPF